MQPGSREISVNHQNDGFDDFAHNFCLVGSNHDQ
jgi:hypothetical protein